MKMKVTDQLHISSVGPGTMGKGHEFEVSDAEGAELEKRGLATRVDGGASPVKAEAAPINKMEAAPINKSDIAPIAARRKGANAP